MHSFEDKTQTLLRLISGQASAVAARQGDRVFNFHYDPSEWTQLRTFLPKIMNRLEQIGLTPHLHSFADIITDIFEKEAKMPIGQMLEQESSTNLSHAQYNQTLTYFLTKVPPNHALSLDSPVVAHLRAILDEAAKTPGSVLLLTDVEMLHPLVRVSAFEQVLQGRFVVPTVFFYPGSRGTIGDNPSFLGFYNSDGNYRSTHIY